MSRFHALAVVLSLLASPAIASSIALAKEPLEPSPFLWPTDFSPVPIGSGWNQATGLCFANDGRMFVWEKAGKVWNVENGVKGAAPLIDIHEEVGDWRDYGMLGFAIDPNFYSNGHIYLLYVVDYHHLKYYGTPSYNPLSNEYFHDTIARLVRYTCNSGDGFHTVDSNSRTVLIGATMSTGFPICHQSHGIGTLVFGEDGTLLVSCGDGASYDQVDSGGPIGGSSNTALADGIIRPKENIGAFRAQLVDCHNGKLLRIDPATGFGIPSNPFYNPALPASPQSRVWAMGLRNPYRVALRPGTGNPDPAAADPGTLIIGDVGWNSREELNVCDAPGLNFGWPIFEGMDLQTGYASTPVANQDAPNPLAGGSCPQYFTFQSLIVQDTLNTPSWPNPCNGSQQIPSNLFRFEHVRPVIDWGHGNPTRTKIYNGNNAATINVGAPGSPVGGVQFSGTCALGGAWYTGTDFPAAYQNTLFMGDYTTGLMMNVPLDAQSFPTEVKAFALGGQAASVVAIATDAVNGGLYFIDYDVGGTSFVKRVVYTYNAPPIAVVDANPRYGPVPLTVQFTGSGSVDPDGGQLAYHWDFGDGAQSTQADPLHVYDNVMDVTGGGSIIGRIFSLNPPHPTGGGNWDEEVIRDGDAPPVGTQDSQRQFDTYHNGDQGNDDWIGYSFPQLRQFRQLVFQEGKHFNDGGWFDTLHVQVWDGATWNDVTHLTISPAYPGNNGITFETFTCDFDPALGTRIRLWGEPGGSADFISIGELRVFATVLGPAGQPIAEHVTLTVTDALNATAQDGLIVSLNNTPPSVSITSPVDGSLFTMSGNTTVPLTAIITDLEHSPAQLFCAWRTILHHDEHTHPEPPDTQCSSSAVITPIGCDGHLYFYEFELTVTDEAGLSTTRSVFMYPDCCATSGGPIAYCTAKINSAGCSPSIGSSGNPSLAITGPFLVTATRVLNNKSGILFYGTSGPTSLPFQGGTLCVAPPILRTAAQFSGGSPTGLDCSGTFSFDFNALIQGGTIAALGPGVAVNAQYWSRDPGFAPPVNTSLTNGLSFTICN